MKKIVLILLFIVGAFSLHAQFNVGVQGSYMRNFSTDNIGHFGFGLRAEAGLSDEVALQAGFHYFFPGNYDHEFEVEAFLPTTTPQTIKITRRSKITFTGYYVGVKYYVKGVHSTFKKNSETAVYLGGDFGVLVGGFETTADSIDNVDWDYYKLPVTDSPLGAFTNLTLNPSLGIEKLFGSVYLYSELKAYVKIYQATQSGIEIPIPYTFNVNIGLRVPLVGEY